MPQIWQASNTKPIFAKQKSRKKSKKPQKSRKKVGKNSAIIKIGAERTSNGQSCNNFLLYRRRNSTSSRGLSKIVKVMQENCRQGANTSGHKAKGFKSASKKRT